MTELWRKELRSLLPFFALALFVSLLNLVWESFTAVPMLKPLAETFRDYSAVGEEKAAMLFLFTLALTSGLLVREHDDGTMEFLDSLPVSRTRVFFAKVSIAALVMILLTVSDIAISVLFHTFSRNSLDPGFHWELLGVALLLRVCQLFVFFSLGLVISFLRRLGWLMIGLLVWGYIWINESRPEIGVLNLFDLAQPSFEGQSWIIPRRQLSVQLPIAGFFFVVAYGLFVGAGDGLVRGYRKLSQTRVGAALLMCAGMMIAVVAIGLGYEFFDEFEDDGGDSNEVTVTYPSWSTGRRSTTHYDFIYPTNLASRASRLINEADTIYERVGSLLQAGSGDPILVDATSLLPRHAGLAYWQRIRLNLAATNDEKTLAAILAHETVHVLLDRVSDSRLHEKFNSTRFFHEGVATYIEYHYFQPETPLENHRFVAAVMHSRDEVSFDEMVDSAELSQRRDSDLVYPLGEVFVHSLVETYGMESIARIARALVRDDAPEGLGGLELWQDTFQASGMNLYQVIERFYSQLDSEIEAHQKLIDQLPRLRGGASSDSDHVYIAILGEPREGWRPICRFRPSADTPDRLYLWGEALSEEHDLFTIPRDHFPGSTIWYQLGLSNDEGQVIYEPWLEVSVEGSE